MDSFVDTPEGRGTIVEVDLLRSRVQVRMEDAPETIAVFANADIAILRSGKAKRGDAPIPADLAPISGSGKRSVRREKEEPSLTLDPIKFRYSTEAVVDEQPLEEVLPEEPTPEAAETPREDIKPSRSRNRGRRKPENKAAVQSAEEKPENKGENKPKDKPKKQHKAPEAKAPKAEAPAEAPAESEQPAKKKPHRRPHYHRRKPKTGGDSAQ